MATINYNGMALEEVTTPQIFDPPKPRRATNRELARWLAQGDGEWINVKDTWTSSDYLYEYEKYDEPLIKDIRVRKWSDTEWHEPTADYLGIEP